MTNQHLLHWQKLPLKYKLLLCVGALLSCIGLFFTVVFIGMQLNVFTVSGAISARNISLEPRQNHELTTRPSATNRTATICKINTLNTVAPDTAQAIASLLNDRTMAPTVSTMISYASAQFSNNTDLMQQLDSCENKKSPQQIEAVTPKTAYGWANSDEWITLRVALRRDQAVLTQAARDAGINPRLVIASVIGEQFRFFTGLRTAFKNYFEPLKIFGRLSKFSYGIAGLKPETVRIIEQNLLNSKSPFYIGPEYAQFASYTDSELQQSSDPQLARITDPNNNYYSYLYVGLYLRQVSQQWRNSGYDISNNAGVLATLYNLGFRRSVPKENPLPGGAIIVVNGKEYTFGQIADEFYWSGELLEEFPYAAPELGQ